MASANLFMVATLIYYTILFIYYYTHDSNCELSGIDLHENCVNCCEGSG